MTMGRFIAEHVISLTTAYFPAEFPKQCRKCNSVYGEEEWRKLRLDGQTPMAATPAWTDPRTRMVEPAEPAHILEFRTCPCTNTLCASRFMP